ncbi:MAG TPA: MmcQ/YjbR family DNA-binding protein [Phycisphaerales bacterium]|nr:MmcQ/YjbR family DNA-binding protein [Phycisphaerales bacterium]
MAKKTVRKAAPRKKPVTKKGAKAAPTPTAAAGYETAPIPTFCRALPGTTFDIKWGDNYCACVGGKLYCVVETGDPTLPGFKCDDIEFERLTKREGIIPAPYAARHGWVKFTDPKALPKRELEACIRRSYELVVESLPKKVREKLAQ